MSPESYVLLLIGCWLLLASTTLWGILRISRRHYLETGETLGEAAVEPSSEPEPCRTAPTGTPSPALFNIAARIQSSVSAIAPFRTLYRRTGG